LYLKQSLYLEVKSAKKFSYPGYLSPSDVEIPFKFQIRQFSIFVSFVMTINKSQGQSLKNVGIYLLSFVFSHGQLYVAILESLQNKV